MKDADSQITALITRLEAYAANPSSLDVLSQSKTHPDWVSNESERSEATLQLAEELMALQSIYTEDALHVLRVTPLARSDQSPQAKDSNSHLWLPGSTLTLSISTEIESQDSLGAVPLRLAATLPAFYPHSSKPPQFQLLSKYIGGFSVDSTLFGEVLRAFHHQTVEDDLAAATAAASTEDEEFNSDWIGGSMDKGVHWRSGEVILFEGIEWVKEKVSDWWASRESARVQGGGDSTIRPGELVPQPVLASEGLDASSAGPQKTGPPVFTGKLFVTPPIVDRKSEFVGYAASISSPNDVPAVITRILTDKRVARAAHPVINAWICRMQSGVVHRDCDDDGETAAGGRLAHLLDLLELENVIVVVTRWFGGVHLGADRFKLINRAAREALDLAGLLSKTDQTATRGGAKRSH